MSRRFHVAPLSADFHGHDMLVEALRVAFELVRLARLDDLPFVEVRYAGVGLVEPRALVRLVKRVGLVQLPSFEHLHLGGIGVHHFKLARPADGRRHAAVLVPNSHRIAVFPAQAFAVDLVHQIGAVVRQRFQGFAARPAVGGGGHEGRGPFLHAARLLKHPGHRDAGYFHVAHHFAARAVHDALGGADERLDGSLVYHVGQLHGEGLVHQARHADTPGCFEPLFVLFLALHGVVHGLAVRLARVEREVEHLVRGLLLVGDVGVEAVFGEERDALHGPGTSPLPRASCRCRRTWPRGRTCSCP